MKNWRCLFHDIEACKFSENSTKVFFEIFRKSFLKVGLSKSKLDLVPTHPKYLSGKNQNICGQYFAAMVHRNKLKVYHKLMPTLRK